MLIRRLEDCCEFTAGDRTRLKELLHPDRQPTTIRYSLAHASLDPGTASVPHALSSSEVYYILSGRGSMVIDTEECAVAPGQAVYIPPNAVQYIKNTGDGPLAFLCIVDPA
jgi:mannose-6-phosphate isomerase-like protein (cupin superfamily)